MLNINVHLVELEFSETDVFLVRILEVVSEITTGKFIAKILTTN